MKKILLFAATVFTVLSCDQKQGYEITGNVKSAGLDGKYIYMYEYGGNGMALDSALVQNGSFTMKGEQPEPVLRIVRFSENDLTPGRAQAGENAPYSVVFILENGKINILLDSLSYASGTPENDAWKSFQQELAKHRQELGGIMEDMKSDNPFTVEAAENRYNELDKRLNGIAKNYIQNNTDKLSGGKILHDFRYNLTEEERRELIDKADATFVSVPGVPAIIDHLDVLKKVAIGEKFTDFEMADTKGEMHKLSEYVGNGKIVLIDFWASWCPPCRREMPLLVELYSQYKNRGFEIVGISLDSTKEAWEKGIDDLDITWPQLSDLKGWKNSAAAIYGVNLIPHIVLVDGEGTIIAKNIHREELRNKLEELIP